MVIDLSNVRAYDFLLKISHDGSYFCLKNYRKIQMSYRHELCYNSTSSFKERRDHKSEILDKYDEKITGFL